MIESSWRPPRVSDLPSLKNARYIGLDLETHDPNLKTLGPGGIRRDGYIVGISLATDDGFKCYLPIRHEGGDNCDNPDAVLQYVKKQLSYGVGIVGANLGYELEWLETVGIRPTGRLFDVLAAEPLLDETRRDYSLDATSQRYLGIPKTEELMREAAKALGIDDADVKANIWKLPARFVGPYGEDDALLPIQILMKQLPLIKEQQLEKVFEQEVKLIPILHQMRLKGVRVDVDRAQQVYEQFDKEQKQLEHKLKEWSRDADFDVWSNDPIERACDLHKISYPRLAPTPTMKKKRDELLSELLKNGKDGLDLSPLVGNASFTKDWLEQSNNEHLAMIRRTRKLDRMGKVFVKSKIIDLAINGRIHGSLHSVKNEEYGSESGRFSMSNPNMQQIPKRDRELAPLIRSIFIPEDGYQWHKWDHAQQEPRMIIHFAAELNFKGAWHAAEVCQNNPKWDAHTFTVDSIMAVDPFALAKIPMAPRDVAKELGLALGYGMGAAKLAAKLNVSVDTAKEIKNILFDALPYIKPFTDLASSKAEQRGYVKTIMGRRRHYELWGPRKRDWDKPMPPALPREEALKVYGNYIKRQFTYAAMNTVVQGSCADLMKQNIIDCYEAGHVFSLTVHDELDAADKTEKQAREIKLIMESSLKLNVPLKVDIEAGANWGKVAKI